MLVGVEVAQVFLPVGFPDVTDVLIEAIGMTVGVATATALARRQAIGCGGCRTTP